MPSRTEFFSNQKTGFNVLKNANLIVEHKHSIIVNNSVNGNTYQKETIVRTMFQ
jgi:hypothetical protein